MKREGHWWKYQLDLKEPFSQKICGDKTLAWLLSLTWEWVGLNIITHHQTALNCILEGIHFGLTAESMLCTHI